MASAAVDAGSASGVSLDGGGAVEAAMRAVFALDVDTAEADARLVWASERRDLPLLAAGLATALAGAGVAVAVRRRSVRQR